MVHVVRPFYLRERDTRGGRAGMAAYDDIDFASLHQAHVGSMIAS